MVMRSGLTAARMAIIEDDPGVYRASVCWTTNVRLRSWCGFETSDKKCYTAGERPLPSGRGVRNSAPEQS